VNYFDEYTGSIVSSRSLHGGDINEVYHIKADRGDFVVKTNKKKYPGMFQSEAHGLNALRSEGLPVPDVIAVSESAILMPYYPPGKPDMAKAGRQLARLHSTQHETAGLEKDNYIGYIPQINTPAASYADFYRVHRLEAQLNLLRLSVDERKKWDSLLNRIPEFTAHLQKTSLIHGDLWSGNLYHAQLGPLFIDPAAYRGDPLADLAFTELFGGFGSAFYSAYREVLSVSAAYTEVKSFYQIYPLLVHANLFGGGYYQSAIAAAKKYM